MVRLISTALSLVLLVAGCSTVRAALSQQAAPCMDQPFAEAQIPGTPRLTLELATTPDERARGLMFRTSMPDDQGMLFVFEQESRGAFWNMNTLIPLSIAFIDRDGTIVDIQDMRAQEPGAQPDVYPPANPYWYALEANQGWYARNGVTVGNVLAFCLPQQ